MSILISTDIVILFSITVTLRQLLGWIFLHEQFIGNKVRFDDDDDDTRTTLSPLDHRPHSRPVGHVVSRAQRRISFQSISLRVDTRRICRRIENDLRCKTKERMDEKTSFALRLDSRQCLCERFNKFEINDCDDRYFLLWNLSSLADRSPCAFHWIRIHRCRTHSMVCDQHCSDLCIE